MVLLKIAFIGAGRRYRAKLVKWSIEVHGLNVSVIMIWIFDAIRSVFLDDNVPLNLLRENVIQNFFHLIPELCLLVFQMSCHYIVAFKVDWWITSIGEITVGPAIGCGKSINFDLGPWRFEFFRMKNIEDSAWVMNRWEGELVIVVIHNFVLFEYAMNCFGKRNVFVSFEMVDNFLGGHVFMSHFQWYHYQWNFSL